MLGRKEKKNPGILHTDISERSIKVTPSWRLFLDIGRELILSIVTFVILCLAGYSGHTVLMPSFSLLLFFLFIEFTPVRPLLSLLFMEVVLFYCQALFAADSIDIFASILVLLVPGLYACKRRRYPRKVFHVLNELSQEMLHQDSPETLALCAVSNVSSIDRFKHVYIQLLNKDKDELVLVAGTPVYETGDRLQRGRGVGWRCFQMDRPVLVMDTARDLDYISTPVEARSCILAPLEVGGKRFGVLGAESTSWRYFNLRDVEVLSLFAAIISFAFQALEAQQGLLHSIRQQKDVLKEKDHEIVAIKKMMESAVWLNSSEETELQNTDGVCDNAAS